MLKFSGITITLQSYYKVLVTITVGSVNSATLTVTLDIDQYKMNDKGINNNFKIS